MNPEQASDFLNSLELEKGQAEEMHGISLTEPLDVVFKKFDEHKLETLEEKDYWASRAIYFESLQIPDLKEKVKTAMLAAMDAQAMAGMLPSGHVDLVKLSIAKEFRALCAQEVKP
jgi:hypothetical protein